MQDVKTALEDFGIDKQEILDLLEQEKLIDAIRIFDTRTKLDLANTLSLLQSIQNGEDQFIFRHKPKGDSLNVSYKNEGGKVGLNLREGNGAEKRVFPYDRDWPKVKKASGPMPEIAEYEEEYLKDTINYSKKSALFVEESVWSKWKPLLIIMALLVLGYFIYQKF